MSLVTLRASEPDAATATIASGQSVSDAVDLQGRALVRVVMPAGWDPAALTFQVSEDNTTWNDLYDAEGAEVSATVAAGRAVVLPPATFPSMKWVRLRSGTAAAAVNQGAARSLRLLSRGV